MNDLIRFLNNDNQHLRNAFKVRKALFEKDDLSLEEEDLRNTVNSEIVKAKQSLDYHVRKAKLSNRVFPANVDPSTKTIMKALLSNEDFLFNSDKDFSVIMILLGVKASYYNVSFRNGFVDRQIRKAPASYDLLLNFYFSNYREMLKNYEDDVKQILVSNIQHGNAAVVKRMIEKKLISDDLYDKLLLLAVQYRKTNVMKMLIETYKFKIMDEIKVHGGEKVSAVTLALSVNHHNLTQADADVNTMIKYYSQNPVN